MQPNVDILYEKQQPPAQPESNRQHHICNSTVLIWCLVMLSTLHSPPLFLTFCPFFCPLSSVSAWFVRPDVPAPEQPELFLKKLQQCCTVFDFMDTLSDLKMKEYKRSTLNELVDYVTVSRGYLTEQAYPEVVKMVSGQCTATERAHVRE